MTFVMSPLSMGLLLLIQSRTVKILFYFFKEGIRSPLLFFIILSMWDCFRRSISSIIMHRLWIALSAKLDEDTT